jgi:hypothetical protein
VLRCFLLALFVVVAFVPAAHGANYLRLGFDDDTIKWIARPNGFVALQQELGAPFTRISIPWRRGEVGLPPVVQTYLGRARMAGDLHQKVIIAVYGDASQAPTTPRLRAQYCRYVRNAVARLPYMSAVVIWNEANSPRYWPQSAGASAYEALLARCYDVLHALRPTVNVVDSTASHHDPAAFIRALGEAYLESGRGRPIVDTFGHNPYPEYAAEVPWATHPDTGTIGEGDYATLISALTQAFEFTAQRVPSATWPRLWYLEDGFQTEIPWPLRLVYTGYENDRTVLPAVAPGKSQASQLTAAISLAYCQPATSAFFNFELTDEHRLVGWQSGLLYADGIPKQSFATYEEIASAVASRSIDCTKVFGAPQG